MTSARRRGTLHLALGLGLLTTAIWGLARDVEWIAQPFYVWAWWGYILALDGAAARMRGHSLLTTRRRFFVPMCLASVTFWFFFELLNVRFQNWYYVGVFPGRTVLGLAGAGAFAVAAFATVFVGLFATYECLTACGLLRRWRGAPKRLPVWVSYALQGLGLLMASAALLFPYYLAPLVWGSFTFLVDPWNYRRGTRSILRDVEARDWGMIARFFLAGLVCGVVWESFNFFAPQKWIYTVRGLEAFKLFEMPLLGFLGFPGLAYDSLAGFALFSSFFLGGETWEHPGDLAYEIDVAARPDPRRLWIAAACMPPFWAAVTLLVIRTNVGSIQLELEDVVTPAEQIYLEGRSIHRPRQLLRAIGEPEGRARLLADSGWSEERLAEVEQRTRLYAFKGIGWWYGQGLENVGVCSVADLRDHDPVRLQARLAALGDHPPRLDMVRVWVLASRSPGVVLRQAR